VPGALHAGAWRTKQLHTHDKYEPKSRSRRTSDQFDEKIIIVRGAQKTFAWYWIKNAGDGENFQHKDVVFE
jgi:hypothetical protein